MQRDGGGASSALGVFRPCPSSPFTDRSRGSMSYRTASVAVLLSTLFGDAAFAHEVRFGSQWSDLQFMDDGPSEVVMVVDVLEVRAGRGKRLANDITGRIIKGRERSGVLADEQYRDLLRSVSEGQNLRTFQSTVVTSADRVGTTSWTPEGVNGKAVVDLRFAHGDGGLWEGTVKYRALDADKALQGEYRAVANRFFLRGKSGGDWLLMVTVMEEPPGDTPAAPWLQPPSWSPEEAWEQETWQ